jgi:hypothetical protein
MFRKLLLMVARLVERDNIASGSLLLKVKIMNDERSSFKIHN